MSAREWCRTNSMFRCLVFALYCAFSTNVLVATKVIAGEITNVTGDDGSIATSSGIEMNNYQHLTMLLTLCQRGKCSIEDISYLDKSLNKAYANYMQRLTSSDADMLRDEQRAWIRVRNDECGISYSGSDRKKWLAHILGSKARTACVARLTKSKIYEFRLNLRRSLQVEFAVDKQVIHGRKQNGWVRAYWEWIRQYSRMNYPAADISGKRCAQGQLDDVWFLTGSVGQDRMERSCTIPFGTTLVIPALSVLVQPDKENSVNCSSLSKKAHDYIDSSNDVYLKIDGFDYTEQALHNIISECFHLEDKRSERSGDAVGAGLWAFLEPLSPGEHKIEFGGVDRDGFRQEIVYNLNVQRPCTMPLEASEADIIAIGHYQGLVHESIQLGDSGSEVKSSPVVVNHPQKPVVLILSAYDPTWWKVSLTPGTKLNGVILSGYHTQAVTGISRDVPLINAVYEGKGSCPYFMAYKPGKDLDKAKERIKQITGHKLNRYMDEPRGDRFLVGSDDYDPATLISSDDYIILDYPVKHGLQAGLNGIEQLTREGRLREATDEDIMLWKKAVSKHFPEHNPEKMPYTFINWQSYVVLKPVTMPMGMYGAHSRSFLIPKGVPVPRDPGSHNTYYFMETGKCRGASSGCEH